MRLSGVDSSRGGRPARRAPGNTDIHLARAVSPDGRLGRATACFVSHWRVSDRGARLNRCAMLPRMRALRGVGVLLLFLVSSVALLNAKVVRVEIASRGDILNGRRFGDAGAYERITGRVYFSLAVANPHNRRIVDLDNAVNLENGEVEFCSDFMAIRPKDPQKGNGSLLLEVPNRGRSRIIGLLDGGDWNLANDAGDAWLLRNGYTVAALGWQWDAAGQDALRFFAPIAKAHGRTITGLLRGDLMPSKVMEEIPLGHLILGTIGGTEYPVAAPGAALH